MFVASLPARLIVQKIDYNEHGQGKREGKHNGKSDKRITESKARQKEALLVHHSGPFFSDLWHKPF
jgi:hypothetical protein